jgi:hypothetical protein
VQALTRTLTQMARAQGNTLRHTEQRTLTVDYRKYDAGWRIERIR